MVYHRNPYQHTNSQRPPPTRTSVTSRETEGTNMYYLIHTPNYPRPYLSTVSFIANDFANWGCRVTCHTKNSPYITEIRYQEKRTRPACRRTELLELWATEVLARKQQQSAPGAAQQEETRKDRASAFVQDFVSSLSTSESPTAAPTALPNDPLQLPAYPLAPVAKYTRLLDRCAYTTNATLPPWAHRGVTVADQIALEFRFGQSLKRAQLFHALTEAIGKKSGRMGKIERSDESGVTRAVMWVDVTDLVVREMGDCGKEEDPVPMYEQGGWVWPPSYEACVL